MDCRLARPSPACSESFVRGRVPDGDSSGWSTSPAAEESPHWVVQWVTDLPEAGAESSVCPSCSPRPLRRTASERSSCLRGHGSSRLSSSNEAYLKREWTIAKLRERENREKRERRERETNPWNREAFSTSSSCDYCATANCAPLPFQRVALPGH